MTDSGVSGGFVLEDRDGARRDESASRSSATPAPRRVQDAWLRRRLGRLVLTRLAVVFAVAAALGITVGLAAATFLVKRQLEASPGLAWGMASEITALFVTASLWSAGIGTLAALVVWGVFASVTARQIDRSVATVEQAAALVAEGRYAFALRAAQIGPEAEAFARTVTTMAARLNEVEHARRRMLSDLAHELRTPIATIDGHLEAFEDGVAHPDAETLAMLRGETRRLARLARDLGAVSRAEEGADPLERRSCAVADLVQEAVTRARSSAAARGLALRCYVAPEVPLLDVDPERIGQVLTNLLDNAVRHARTAVGVTARPATDADGAEHVHVCVRDDGEGIPAEAVPHIFDRFFRADNARRAGEGSGIGLTIARALVARHGGRIDVVTSSTGTEFTAVLPVPSR